MDQNSIDVHCITVVVSMNLETMSWVIMVVFAIINNNGIVPLGLPPLKERFPKLSAECMGYGNRDSVSNLPM